MVFGHVHCIGYDGCRSVSHCGRLGKHGNRIRNAERKTSSAPAARRDAANQIAISNRSCAEERSSIRAFNHSHDKGFFVRKMQGDIATIVHISLGEPGVGSHGRQNFLRHRTRHRCHWGNENVRCVRLYGLSHPSGNGARGKRTVLSRGRS